MADKVDDYKLIIIQNSVKLDITGAVDGLSWASDIDTLSSQLSFGMSKATTIKPRLGNHILLLNNSKLVIQGVITNLNESKDSFAVTVNDYAWYFNKSKLYIQFKDVSVSDAIRELCSKLCVPVDSICTMKTKVKKIYSDKTVSDVLNDLLAIYTKESKFEVRMEMLGGMFRVYVCKDMIINPTYKQAENLAPFKVMDAIGDDWSISQSIEDMINSVVISTDSNKPLVKDDINIKAYGLLQEIINVGDSDVSTAKKDAKNLFNQKNVIPKAITISCLGDDSIVAGRSIILSSLGNSKYLIKSASHSYSGIHTVSMTLVKGGQ